MSSPGKPNGPSTNARLAGMGTELAAAVAAGSLLGYWIDRKWQTAPWGLIVCAIVAIVGGLYNLIRQYLNETGTSTPSTRKRPDDSERPEP